MSFLLRAQQQEAFQGHGEKQLLQFLEVASMLGDASRINSYGLKLVLIGFGIYSLPAS